MNPELEAQIANLLESIRQQTEAHNSTVAAMQYDIDDLISRMAQIANLTAL